MLLCLQVTSNLRLEQRIHEQQRNRYHIKENSKTKKLEIDCIPLKIDETWIQDIPQKRKNQILNVKLVLYKPILANYRNVVLIIFLK